MLLGSELFRPGTDTLSLSDFARPKQTDHLVDLGCGCGTFELLLGRRFPALRMTGIEIDPAAVSYALANVADMSDRVTILQEDLRTAPLPDGCADGVISNPPYFSRFSGKGSSIARTDDLCSCQELVQAAARLLHPGGRFWLLWRPERLVELLTALHSAGLEPKRMQAARGRQVRFVMIEALRCGHPGLVWEPELDLQRR